VVPLLRFDQRDDGVVDAGVVGVVEVEPVLDGISVAVVVVVEVEEEEEDGVEDTLAAASSVVDLCLVGPKQRLTEVISPISKNPNGFCEVADL